MIISNDICTYNYHNLGTKILGYVESFVLGPMFSFVTKTAFSNNPTHRFYKYLLYKFKI